MYTKIVPQPLTLKSLMDYSLANFAENKAVSFVEGSPMSYKELGASIDAMAALLQSFGLKKGDKVALYCQNMPNWVAAYFSVVSYGMVIVPILPDFTAAEFENVIQHSEAKILFVSEKLKSRAQSVDLSQIKAIIGVDNLELLSGETAEKLVAAKAAEVEENDIAAIIYTSGTTGRSKGVVLTHKNITFVASQSYTFFPINKDDVFLSFLPLSHTYENSIGMLYPLIYGASIYYLEKPPTAASLIPAMKKIRPTMMMSVPLIMEKLYKSQIQAKFVKTKFSRLIYKNPLFRILIHRIAGKKLYQTFGGKLKFFGIGGAKLDSRVERFLREARFPYAIGYGLTETAPLLAGAGPSQTRLQSTGFATEGVELKIFEPNKKGVGEIWAKGPNVMVGYYKNPEATAEVLTEDGWFRTGDFGKFDAKKRLYIKGRMKNTIVGASGENIYPEDIESVINNNKYVVESLVVEEDGYLVAKVILDIEAIESNIEHIKSIFGEKKEQYNEWKKHFTKELNAKLNRSSQINRVDVMDEPFEKTASQKIKRFLYTKTQQTKAKAKERKTKK
jgi:long-chain acyl-CoA synthetase